MGICFAAFTATDEMLEAVHADPPLIWRLYAPDDEAPYLEEIGAGRRPGPIARLFGARERPVPDPLPGFVYRQGDYFEVDLDKSWGGISFCLKKLLPGDCPNVFEDGTAVDRLEIGYSPAITFTRADTERMAGVYTEMDPDDVVAALAPTEMKRVYPEALWRRGDAEIRAYVRENFVMLVAFLERAAQRGLGIVVVYE